MRVSEWWPAPERLPVRVGNPDGQRWVECDAVIDLSSPRAFVPSGVYADLALPTFGFLQFEAETTCMSLGIAYDGLVHLPLAALTGLGLEFDRTNKRLRSFEALLPLAILED